MDPDQNNSVFEGELGRLRTEVDAMRGKNPLLLAKHMPGTIGRAFTLLWSLGCRVYELEKRVRDNA